MARQKIDPEEKYPTCERCGAKVPRVDYIDVSKLTAKASYWRDMPNRIGVCPECSKNLSALIDIWWSSDMSTIVKNKNKKERQINGIHRG